MVGWTGLAGVDMETEGDDDDGVDGEEDEGVEGHGLAVRPHASELHRAVGAGGLQDEPRREQNEQNHPHHHRRPICHEVSLPFIVSPSMAAATQLR